jgi:hypothetical protein
MQKEENFSYLKLREHLDDKDVDVPRITMLKGNLEKLCVTEEYRSQKNAVGWYGRRIYCNEQQRKQSCITVSYSNAEAEDSMTASDRTPRFTELYQVSEASLHSVTLRHRHLNVSFSLTFP